MQVNLSPVPTKAMLLKYLSSLPSCYISANVILKIQFPLGGYLGLGYLYQ